MVEYVVPIFAFAATLIGVFGRTVDDGKRITRSGWIAIGIATLSCIAACFLVFGEKEDQSRAAIRNNELEGVALIQLQRDVNRHVRLWRSLTEDGFDPKYFGDTVFELPSFMESKGWQDKIESKVPDYAKFRKSYEELGTDLRATLEAFKGEVDSSIRIAALGMSRGSFAEYFRTTDATTSAPGQNIGQIMYQLRTDPFAELAQLVRLVRNRFKGLNLPEDFEQKNRRTDDLKDDLT